jgi:hypothetical protein
MSSNVFNKSLKQRNEAGEVAYYTTHALFLVISKYSKKVY